MWWINKQICKSKFPLIFLPCTSDNKYQCFSLPSSPPLHNEPLRIQYNRQQQAATSNSGSTTFTVMYSQRESVLYNYVIHS